jgi:hypothetical protein
MSNDAVRDGGSEEGRLLTLSVLSIPPLAAHLNAPLLKPTHSTDIVPSSS